MAPFEPPPRPDCAGKADARTRYSDTLLERGVASEHAQESHRIEPR